MEFKLGQLAKDKISGFTGVISCVAKYLYAEDSYCLTPKVNADNKVESMWIPPQQIEIVDDKISQPEKISVSEKPLENGVIKKEKKSKKAVEEEFDLKSNLETSSSDIPDAGSDLLPEPEEKKAPEKELSLDKDVKPAFAEYVKEHGAEGRQKAKKMLSENFGVENLPSLKAKDYKKALKLLSEL